MKVAGRQYRTIWLEDDGWSVGIIDQTLLPHSFEVCRLTTVEDAARAIATMQVRGAPLIGATAAYGLCLALRADPSGSSLERAGQQLIATRPTAVNLRWAVAYMIEALRDPKVTSLGDGERVAAAYDLAAKLCDEDVAINQAIGTNGMRLIEMARSAKSDNAQPVQILTHCNAGWLATVDCGTALAPIYQAHDAGIAVHVWVDETRPRNQGFSLTAWELQQHGVPFTVITDNAGGLLMQRGAVDLCITGTDRTTAGGDVCNKIGTYLKALAAHDNGIPFYVALPSPTIDWTLHDGGTIPIEERDPGEVTHVSGRDEAGQLRRVALVSEGSPAANHAFDITPARLVTALVTERGVCAASREGLLGLFPERRDDVQEA